MFLIAEIGSNWDGDIQLAYKTIDACKHAGADAVKFQLWKTEIIYPDNPENKKWELSFEQCEKLKLYCDQIGIMFLCTPSYPEAVDFLESLKVPMYKVASVTSAMKHPFSLETMHKIADTGKPVIISNGYGNRTENIFKDNHIFELNCVAKYPAKISEYNQFSDYDGVSDHTTGTTLMFRWIKRNHDVIIEKHVKLRDNSSPDSPFSLYTKELADFITLSKLL